MLQHGVGKGQHEEKPNQRRRIDRGSAPQDGRDGDDDAGQREREDRARGHHTDALAGNLRALPPVFGYESRSEEDAAEACEEEGEVVEDGVRRRPVEEELVGNEERPGDSVRHPTPNGERVRLREEKGKT